MKAAQHIQERLEKIRNELLYILAKTVVAVLVFLSLLWWVVVKMNGVVSFILGALVLAGLLFLIMRWWKAYFKLRKEYCHLEKQYKLQLDSNTNNHESDTPLIVFRRH